MLVITRKASRTGELGSSFTVGDMVVSLIHAGERGVKLRVLSGKRQSVSSLPYGCVLRPMAGVAITPVIKKGKDKVRLGIEAPTSIAIERDDMRRELARAA